MNKTAEFDTLAQAIHKQLREMRKTLVRPNSGYVTRAEFELVAKQRDDLMTKMHNMRPRISVRVGEEDFVFDEQALRILCERAALDRMLTGGKKPRTEASLVSSPAKKSRRRS